MNYFMKRVLVLIISLFLVSTLFGQYKGGHNSASKDKEKSFIKEIGIGVGYPFPVSSKTTANIGLAAELKMTYPISDYFNFSFGVELNQLKQEKDTIIFTLNTACKDAKMSSWYLTVPLAFSFYPIESHNWSVFAGAYTGVRLSAKTEGIFYDPSDYTAPMYDMSKDAPMKKVDFGVDLGFSYHLVLMKKYKLNIKPKYRFGLIKLLENKSDIYNQGFQLMLSVEL